MVLAATAKEIGGKRKSTTSGALKRKFEAGQDIGTGRAHVRLGKTQTAILIGKEDLSTWDSEELAHGRRRGPAGNFEGGQPKVVAKAVHNEFVRRTLSKATRLLNENLEVAVTVLTGIMEDETAEPKDRLRAIQMIMDRAMGKEPVKVDIGQEAPWQLAIANSIISMPEELIPGEDDGEEGEESELEPGDD